MFSHSLKSLTFTRISLLSQLSLKPELNTNPLINCLWIRNISSFYTRGKAAQLWKGALSVSKNSQRRGRKGGGGKIVEMDLSSGHRLGVGRKSMVWPGLNAPIVEGRHVVRIQSLGEDRNFSDNLNKSRRRMRRFTEALVPQFFVFKVGPLERGWSSAKMGGRWIGPPEPVNGEQFHGFDTQVLILKPIFNMTSKFGKFKRYYALSVTGNMNGLAGYAVGKHIDSRVALLKSKNKAAQNLQHFNLLDGNSLYHNFYSKFYATELFVKKMPKGYGVVAHRCINSICQTLGLTDIYCKVKGSASNHLHITRAFLNGLMNQKTYQQMADEKGLNVVEIVGKYNYPVVLARPQNKCRTEDEISPDEILDYDMYIYDGKVIHPPLERPVYYTKLPSWETYTKKYQYRQSQDQSRIDLIAKYGSIESYITQLDRQRIKRKRTEFFEKMSAEAVSEQQENKELESDSSHLNKENENQI